MAENSAGAPRDRAYNAKAWEVRAFLDGRKTMMRVPLTPQPSEPFDGLFHDKGKWWTGDALTGDVIETLRVPYEVGDRLWLREAHYLTDNGDSETAVYAADAETVRKHLEHIDRMASRYRLDAEWSARHKKLRPSIHMPRWVSRITLVVESVKVERLQDISEEDAVAEGIRTDAVGADTYIGREGPGCWVTPWLTAREAFEDLWTSLHGPNAWKANPWIAAYSLRVVLANIDAMEAVDATD